MKKTKKTLMTAAAFAAAMNIATASNVNAVSSADENSFEKQKYDPSQEEIQDVYGPAPDYFDDPLYYGELPVTTTGIVNYAAPLYGPPWVFPDYTGTIPPEYTTTTTTTTIEPEVLYGPPWVFPDYTGTMPEELTTTTEIQTTYGPPVAYFYEKGDANGDGVVDVFDIIALRKRLLSSWGSNATIADRALDVNNDCEIGVGDLVSLQNFLLGRRTDFEEPIPQPAYGPAPDYIEDLVETTTSTTTKKTRTTSGKKTITTTTTTTTASIDDPIVSALDPSDMPIQLMYGPPEYFGLDPDTLQPKEK